MSSRKLKSAPVATGPGQYRVTWSADFGPAVSAEEAAEMARDALAALLAGGGPLPLLAERHDDTRQGKLLFGIASVPVVVECEARADTTAPARQKARKPVKAPAAPVVGPEAFWQAMGAAMRAAVAARGPRWKFHGDAVTLELPAKLRSYVATGEDGEKGSRIRYMRDHWAPPAVFWPGGVIPEGPNVTPCYPVAKKRVLFDPFEPGHERRYERWLKAWRAQNPETEEMRDAWQNWLASLPGRGDPDFRYDAADRAALFAPQITAKLADREFHISEARGKKVSLEAEGYSADYIKSRVEIDVSQAWKAHYAAMALMRKAKTGVQS